jgi:hypothetical protein
MKMQNIKCEHLTDSSFDVIELNIEGNGSLSHTCSFERLY